MVIRYVPGVKQNTVPRGWLLTMEAMLGASAGVREWPVQVPARSIRVPSVPVARAGPAMVAATARFRKMAAGRSLKRGVEMRPFLTPAPVADEACRDFLYVFMLAKSAP